MRIIKHITKPWREIFDPVAQIFLKSTVIRRNSMKCFWSGFTVGVGLGGGILFFYVSQSISVVIIFWVIVAILALAVYKS